MTKKKFAVVLFAIVAFFALIWGEWRYIMTNLHPYYAEDGFLCIEFMGHTDSYYAESIFGE